MFWAANVSSVLFKYSLKLLNFYLSPLFVTMNHKVKELVPRLASAATWAHARARGAGLSRTHQHTATSPLKGLRDPEEMAME